MTNATVTAAKTAARTFFTLRILPGWRMNLIPWYSGITEQRDQRGPLRSCN